MPRILYEDRNHAGMKLAEVLQRRHFENPFILGLPRGGVVLSHVVARILEAPMDVVISRKIGAPGNEEFGIGAVSEDGFPYFTPGLTGYYNPDSESVRLTVFYETQEVKRRVIFFRDGRPLPSLTKHTVVVVDDGLATGVTAIAAGKYLKGLRPLKLILAVPLAPRDYPRELLTYFDEIVCPFFLDDLMSVGLCYREFAQVTDEEVRSYLNHENNIHPWKQI